MWTPRLRGWSSTRYRRSARCPGQQGWRVFTEKIGNEEPVEIYRLPGMGNNMICINGDAGDAAQLLGLPLILFDDREDNLDDVQREGSKENVGVLVRRGDAIWKSVNRKYDHLVINNPHDWVY